ncbi:MAG: transcription-repair coupling factor [Candidatus Eremiobacteraeota bacterium]|nr:transcription-repair coupling factor [Candidatus Eremiobacteraeota bacterium]
MIAQIKPPSSAESARAGELLAALTERSRSWQSAVARVRALRAIEGRKPGGYALHETIAAARPALLAALHESLGGTLLAILATPDAAERHYADLLYYVGEQSGRVALLRSRDEALGAIETPSERSARMTLLGELLDGRPRIVLAPMAALRQSFMRRDQFASARFTVRPGDDIGFDRLQERLFALGYSRCDVVSAVGEYAVRGGIIDLFAATAQAPARIEFFGDTIESMRSFAIESQRSSAQIAQLEVVPWSEDVDSQTTFFDYLPPNAIIVLEEPATIAATARALDDERARERHTLIGDEQGAELLDAQVRAQPVPLPAIGERIARHATLAMPGAIELVPEALDWVPSPLEDFVYECRPVEHFNRQIGMFSETMRQWIAAGETIFIVSTGVSRIADLLRAAGVDPDEARSRGGVAIDHGSIDAGFRAADLRLRVLGDREIFGTPPKRVKIRAVKEGVPVALADLRVGDYVVHAVHGIGQYLGLRAETVLGATQDYLDLRYAGSDRMLVPVTQMHQIGKYAASEGQSPRLSKMGGADWARTKSRVSESLAKIADRLVTLYAQRELARGFAFGPDTTWQGEMEEAFAYEPTPDQQLAIDAAKGDMERAQPMDRLVCGDVGYGKTEVAMRAAFKAIADKKQVAVLVPTTLLADQHYRTFSARFGAFPVRVEMLSRFTPKADQRRILRDLAEGRVDVVIGTHRLLQKDVAFADLGLIVVDEEQRFGVMHKERLKEYRASVDVLTLSATPIPRTLHMSLLGVRDLSLIQTAPKNRMSIKTLVVPASDAIVQRAIAAELDRGGQVYYLHNRIESIYAVRNALAELVPHARIAVGHGQMRESELEPVMQRFIDGEIDVLIATTIIENGIDIPNVNTMIVNDADRFGLAQLYQLRGRVGRSNHQAYCYLLYQGHKALTDDAKARLEAIREFAHLGSGLQIAMRDLEIRGAGNLLGSAQSGFIASVGFDTYCELLAEAIAQRRGTPEALEREPEAVIDVKVNAFIPNDYISQVSQKIAVYQQLAKARTTDEVEEVEAGVRDRFGPFPLPLRNLIEVTKLRTIALRKRVTRVVVDERRLTFGVGSGFELRAAALPEFARLTKNRFRFGDGRIVVELPADNETHARRDAGPTWMPLLRSLLEAI